MARPMGFALERFVRPRESARGRTNRASADAQLARTINILGVYFPIFHYLYTLFKKESKGKICLKSKEMKFWHWTFYDNKDQKPGR